MKLHAVRSWLAAALCVFVSVSVNVQQCHGAPTASKLVDMRESVVPAWTDVAASGDVTKVAPLAITKYWNRLEVEDIERFALKLVVRTKRSRAKQAIEEFYDAANACLSASGTGPSLKKAAFESLAVKLRKCIAMDSRMPKFVVEDDAAATVSDFVDPKASSGGASVTPPPASEPVTTSPSPPPAPATSAPPVNESSTAPSLFEPFVVATNPTPAPTFEPTRAPPSADQTSAPTSAPTAETTPAPTVVVALSPTVEATPTPTQEATPASTQEVPSTPPTSETPAPTPEATPAPATMATPSASTAMTPAPTPNVIPAPATVPPPQDPIRPALNSVPAMSVLDPDGSGDVSMAEWEAYVASLKTVALKLVSGIKEPRSKTLLDKIVSFHYDTLWRCLEKHVATSPAEDFAALVKVIDAHCYVKFRYSLFAGLPPFEFIARDKPAVPASLVTKWISQSLVVARTDMTGARALGFPHATLTHLESVVRCVAIAMQAAPTQAIDKMAYHRALALVDQCSTT